MVGISTSLKKKCVKCNEYKVKVSFVEFDRIPVMSWTGICVGIRTEKYEHNFCYSCRKKKELGL